MNNILKFSFLSIIAAALVACGGTKDRSSATGWKYNDQEWGGFEKIDYDGQITGPNLVMIPGGTFLMGLTGEDVTYEWDNLPRRVTVTSFYMDETEITNINYREYIYWLNHAYGENYPEVTRNALPDTLVWREELAFNEPYVHNYFRHPAYDDYPVVGVTWEQANEYCKWRTDRVNEMILIEEGIINPSVNEQKGADVFNTEAYYAGQYTGNMRKGLEDQRTGEERNVRRTDGLMLPAYRLPTEAEWEYAALGLQGKLAPSGDELITDRRLYPWDGNTARYQRRDKHMGKMLANFKRGSGDYMGIGGAANDAASVPGEVRTYYPNDYGLYNMAGNVSEWTADVYRPLTFLDLQETEEHDLNPFRGNVFKKLVTDETGALAEKDSLGRLRYEPVDDSTLQDRFNYRNSDLRAYDDGDQEYVEYGYGKTTLINDESRVIKGGSWADRLYWLRPGTRRYMDQDKASKSVGFRCAMVRVGGSTEGAESKGFDFNRKTPKVKRKYD